MVTDNSYFFFFFTKARNRKAAYLYISGFFLHGTSPFCINSSVQFLSPRTTEHFYHILVTIKQLHLTLIKKLIDSI